jgi:hypothetical protein
VEKFAGRLVEERFGSGINVMERRLDPCAKFKVVARSIAEPKLKYRENIGRAAGHAVRRGGYATGIHS